jgi:hypothetical protein
VKKRALWGGFLALWIAGADPAAAQSIQNVVLRNSFNPTGAGARGLGMGGAFIAVADDGTAASFNPAGLAQLRRSEIAFVGFHDRLQSTVTAPGGEDLPSFTDEATHGALDFAGVAVPFQVAGRNFTLQLSYQRSVDLFGRGRATVIADIADIDPDLGVPGDVIVNVSPEQKGAFHTASLSAAWQLTSKLSLGLGINYWFADWNAQGTSEFRARVRLPGLPQPLELPLLNIEFDQDQAMRGVNANLGLLLRYPWLSIGGVVRTPFDGSYDLDENNLETTYDLAGRPTTTESKQYLATSQMHVSWGFGAGIAIRPFRGLTLAADYTRADWSRTTIANVPNGALLTPEETGADDEPLPIFTDRNFFDLLPAPETSTSNTSQWRAGAEYLVSFSKLIVPLRAGLFRDRSPIVPIGSDAGRLIEGWTVGAGLNFSGVVLDFAFERRESEGPLLLRLRGGNPVPAANPVTEQVKQDRIVASLIFRFGSGNDPIKGLFGSLFGDSKDDGQ